jgi:hypothetical protein
MKKQFQDLSFVEKRFDENDKSSGVYWYWRQQTSIYQLMHHRITEYLNLCHLLIIVLYFLHTRVFFFIITTNLSPEKCTGIL